MAANDHGNTGLSAEDAFLISPSDTVELAAVTNGVSFSVAGALKVKTANGTTIIIPSGSLAAGVIHPLRVRQVFSTGTGVTDVVGYR